MKYTNLTVVVALFSFLCIQAGSLKVINETNEPILFTIIGDNFSNQDGVTAKNSQTVSYPSRGAALTIRVQIGNPYGGKVVTFENTEFSSQDNIVLRISPEAHGRYRYSLTSSWGLFFTDKQVTHTVPD